MPYAANYDLTVDRGAVFQEVLTLVDANDEPIDISTFTLFGEVRDPNAVVPAVAAEFQFEHLSLGSVAFILPPEESLKLKKGKFYTYDIFIRFSADPGSNDMVRLLEGEIDLRMNTTKTPLEP